MAQKNLTHPKTVTRQRRKDARPAEILDAAFVEFADKGYRATRLDDVAARAGIAKATIYVYYADKDAVFEEAVRSRIIPVLGEVGDLVDTFPGTTADLLRQVISAFYGRMGDPATQTLLRIMIADGPAFPQLLEFYHREFLSKAEGLLRQVVNRGLARGEFRKSAATDLPMVLMGPGLMAAIWQMTFSQFEPVSMAMFQAAHVDLALLGLQFIGDAE